MDIAKINQWLLQIDDHSQEIRDLVSDIRYEVNKPPIVVVPAGADLQDALDNGGSLELASGAVFLGNYVMRQPGTFMLGRGENRLSGEGGPALDVALGFTSGIVDNVALEVAHPQEFVLRVGRNDPTQTPDNMPNELLFRAVAIYRHRGKHAIECHGSAVFEGCTVMDTFDPEGLENQAFFIGNTAGPVRVEACHFGGSMVGLIVGGDYMKMPGVRPTGIAIVRCTITNPIEWKTAGTPKVKTLLELKDGHNVTIENCILSNCWKSAQVGYGFMFTPTRGGSLRNVLVKDCTMSNVAGIVNITGIDNNFPAEPRTQVTFRGGSYRTNTDMGAVGRFALIERGPDLAAFHDLQVQHHGSAFIDSAGDKVPIAQLHVIGCTWNYGIYGIRIGGYNHGDNRLGLVKDLKIEGNTIQGAHAEFKVRYPGNTYV